MTAMMSDKEFAELELRATICPGQCRWPKPENVVWQKLHEAANEARARVSEFYTLVDEIDRNAGFSRDDKYHQRSKSADEAIADFDGSRTLARAREAVRLLVDRDNPEMVEAALKQVERGWRRAIDMVLERAAQAKAPRGARGGVLMSWRI
jgi:hypothetical protein